MLEEIFSAQKDSSNLNYIVINILISRQLSEGILTRIVSYACLNTVWKGVSIHEKIDDEIQVVGFYYFFIFFFLHVSLRT